MEECIFCKIIQKKVNAEIVYEDDSVIAFPDINPIAPVHILVIPKEHIESANDLTDNEKHERIAGRLLIVARKIAKTEKIDEKGYKMLVRTGTHGGQEIPHIHLHLLGGARLSEGIGPIGG